MAEVAAAPRRPWALPGAAVLALVLAGALWLQRAALWAPFFADDYLFLDQVRARSLPAVLASPDPIGNFVRPIGRQLDFWLLARAGGESPVPFHVVNLALFLVALALLFAIARRLAGTAAAAVAAGFVALHYAADVPLLWASGSQDLLALALALAAIALFLGDRRWPAAATLLVGMLSKETVLFTPLVAALAARRTGEPWWRTLLRAWPLALAPALWASLWLALTHTRPGLRQAVGWSVAGLAAAFVHLGQVALGLEWRSGGGLRLLEALPPFVPVLLVLGAVTFAAANGAGGGEPRGLPPVRLGLAWAALGALPVAAVATVWSAYYYLFALCGLGLALGAWLGPRHRAVALVVLALLAAGSQNARRLDEFITAPGIWTRQSHVNRFYVERATAGVGHYLAQLRRLRPTLPHRSTLFFGGLPSFLGFQTGDGPLVRWAYRDSSLRSYYLVQFSAERFRRGPAFVFLRREDERLDEEALTPTFLRSSALSATMALRPRVALDILELKVANESAGQVLPYWRGWLQWALGDTVGARASLVASGAVLAPGPTPEVLEAMKVFAARDTAGAIRLLKAGVWRHARDARAHAVLAALEQTQFALRGEGAIEAFAAAVLGPQEPFHWWILGYAQYVAGRYGEAQESFGRFFALGGGTQEQVNQARRILDELRATGPGGEKFQRSLHTGG